MLGAFASSGLIFSQSSEQNPTNIEFFEKKIRPVLATNCYPCHSADAPKVQGGLWLDSRDGLREGGNSGSSIVPGDPDTSLLIRALRHTEPGLKMPPGGPLDPEIIADFEQWVRLGAPDPRSADSSVSRDLIPSEEREFWSFRRPAMPAIPQVSDSGWARTPVDRFILAKLHEAKPTPSPEAGKPALLRRATYDLIGLPPTEQDIQAFLKDSSPDAFEKVVDRLLSSQHYGERWGRHWLDVARYADTRDRGFRFAFSYTFRDWVIRALNDDMPYNEFVRKQIAADRIDLKDQRDLAALGYITLGRNVPKGEHDMIDDRIDVITRGLLGLTVTCARCHDHKYDPIPTRDYYSFYGIIANSVEPPEYPLVAKERTNSPIARLYREGMERRLRAIDEFKVKRHAELVAEFRSASWVARYLLAAQQASKMSNIEIEKLSRERDYNLFVLRRWRDYLNRKRHEGDAVFVAWHALAALPAKADQFAEQATETLRAALPANANPEIVKALMAKPLASMNDVATVYGEVFARFDSETPHKDPPAEALRLVLRSPNTPTNIELVHFMKIRGAGGDDNIIRGLNDSVRLWQVECAYRGLAPRAVALVDAEQPAKSHVFVRGNPNNLGAEAPRQFLAVLSKEPKPFASGSGRLDLANAIASEDNPLTARVIVNRVWAWHFGRGLVPTLSDFGTRGEPPTHPELLDYLAKRFMEEGWSLKKLHRWIMLSSTYRQSSQDRADARAVDPENKWLWRMNRQRLDFESLRDSILLVSGQLDRTMGGLPYSFTAIPTVPRRTVYAFVERGRLPGDLTTFDFANPEAHVPQRYLTTAPQQALYLMNSPFLAEQVKHLMARPKIASARHDRARIETLYRIVFGRSPSQEEISLALDYVASERTGVYRKAAGEPLQSVWQYGMGAFDEETGRVDFRPFTYFSTFPEPRWQPASLLPQPVIGSPSLRAKGGTPGDGLNHATIRRWVAPAAGSVAIKGSVAQRQTSERTYGDGIRARIVHSREGKLLEERVQNREVELSARVRVEAGDTIDFIVDSIADAENDDFTWTPELHLTPANGQNKPQVWNAAEGFVGPEAPVLTPWERYAQVLLQTNEFAFVD